jgi:hypothetical protein
MSEQKQILLDRLLSRLTNRAVRAALFIAICLLYLISCGSEAASGDVASKPAASRQAAEKTIVALGDSLTAGLGVDEIAAYPAQLQRKLTGAGYHVNVVNAGISGETSSGTLSRILWVISVLKPDIIILETGANDGLRGIDPDVLRKNLKSPENTRSLWCLSFWKGLPETRGSINRTGCIPPQKGTAALSIISIRMFLM